MSKFKEDNEQIDATVETLKTLLTKCEELYEKEVPVSDVDKGQTHEELISVCDNVRTTCYYFGQLVHNTIKFLGKSSEMFAMSDTNSANAIKDSSSGSGGTGSSSSKKESAEYEGLQVPLRGQETNYTCGSASGNMILETLGVNCSESEFWKYANSNGQGTYVYRIAQTLNHFIGADTYKYVYTSGMNLDEYYNTISTSINNGYPVEVVMSIPSGSAFGYSTGGHYAVVTGVYKNASGEYIAKVNDPFSGNWSNNGHQGQQIEVKLSDIQQYNRNHSGYIICN